MKVCRDETDTMSYLHLHSPDQLYFTEGGMRQSHKHFSPAEVLLQHRPQFILPQNFPEIEALTQNLPSFGLGYVVVASLSSTLVCGGYESSQRGMTSSSLRRRPTASPSSRHRGAW